MGVVSRTADLFYAFRFLKLLVTPWNKTGAFEQGIIDENGKNIKKAKELTTPQEKEVYQKILWHNHGKKYKQT